jgi:hypothetical protein
MCTPGGSPPVRSEGGSKEIGVTANTLCNWETGRNEPEVRFFPALIQFLGYDLFLSRGRPVRPSGADG